MSCEVYFPWNLIELEFEAQKDQTADYSRYTHVRFLRLARELDLWIISRPGPYICGEHDFGGLPARLQKLKKIRTYDNDREPNSYISEVKKFWGERLLPSLKDELVINGGNILMTQIENEFGSYGNTKENPQDMSYMVFLKELAMKAFGGCLHDSACPVLFTTDGYDALNKGFVAGVYHVGDFGVDVNASISFTNMKELNQKGSSPDFVSEFYPGWMTQWGDDKFATVGTNPFISALKRLPNFNLYMAYGGTNFDFLNGANVGSKYLPQV